MTLYVPPSPSSERRRLSQTFDRAKAGDSLSLDDVKTLITAFAEQKNFNSDALLLLRRLPEEEQFIAYLHFASIAGQRSREALAANNTGLSFEGLLENASSFIGRLPVHKHYDAWIDVWNEYTKRQSHENPELAETTSKFLNEIVNSIALLKPEKRYMAAASLLNDIHGMKDSADRLDIEEKAYTIALGSVVGENAYDEAVDLYYDLTAFHTLRPQDDREHFETSRGKFQALMQESLQKAMDAAMQLDFPQRFERLISIYKKTRLDPRRDEKYNAFRKSVLVNAARVIDELPEGQQEKAALRVYEQDDHCDALETASPRWVSRVKNPLKNKRETLRSINEATGHETPGEALSFNDVIKVIDILTAEKDFSTDLFTLVKKLPREQQFGAYLHFASRVNLRAESGRPPIDLRGLLENVSPLIDMLEVSKRHDAWWQVWNVYTKDRHHEDPELADTTTFYLKEILTSIELLEPAKRYDAAVNLLNKIHELADTKQGRLGLEEQTYETALKNVRDGEETYDRAIGVYHDLRAYHTLRPQDDKTQFEKDEIKFQNHMQNALAKAVEAAERLDPGQRFERLISIYKKTRRDFFDDTGFRLTVLQKAARAINGLPENRQEDAAYWIYEQTDNYDALDVGNPEWAKRLRKTISDELEAVKSALIEHGLS